MQNKEITKMKPNKKIDQQAKNEVIRKKKHVEEKTAHFSCSGEDKLQRMLSQNQNKKAPNRDPLLHQAC